MIRSLSRRVTCVEWRGYTLMVSQIRWGILRRFIFRYYGGRCPEAGVRYETAVFLSDNQLRFAPEKPLYREFHRHRAEARVAVARIARDLDEGSVPFQHHLKV